MSITETVLIVIALSVIARIILAELHSQAVIRRLGRIETLLQGDDDRQPGR